MTDEIEIKFYCPKCNTTLEHEYTTNDIFSKSSLEFTCQKCGHTAQVLTKKVIDEATQKVIKALGG